MIDFIVSIGYMITQYRNPLHVIRSSCLSPNRACRNDAAHRNGASGISMPNKRFETHFIAIREEGEMQLRHEPNGGSRNLSQQRHWQTTKQAQNAVLLDSMADYSESGWLCCCLTGLLDLHPHLSLWSGLAIGTSTAQQVSVERRWSFPNPWTREAFEKRSFCPDL